MEQIMDSMKFLFNNMNNNIYREFIEWEIKLKQDINWVQQGYDRQNMINVTVV